MPFIQWLESPEPTSTKKRKKFGQWHKGGIFKRGPWLCRVELNASLVVTSPSSPSDKTHFPFISLYHKHEPGGKPSLQAVEARPRVALYLMRYCKVPLGSERSSSNRKTWTGHEGFAYFSSNKQHLSQHIFCCSLRPNYGSRQNGARGPGQERRALRALWQSPDGNA